MKGKVSLINLFPVLFSFYIVGFCDIVGISTSYVQNDFQLDDAIAGLLPAVVFIWFLALSAPATFLLSKIGCKKTVLLGMALTLLGMLVLLFLYNLPGCFAAFMLLGIGNVILQVALNPLLSCVASGDVLSASLTSGQMIKAVSAFCGPFVAAFAMSCWGHWYYVFPVFAVITLISALWLLVTPVHECGMYVRSTAKEAFSLLKDTKILLLFLAVVFVVGTDVGMNVLIPKLMIERCGHTVQDAALGSSVYFAFRILGIFVSTMLLVNLSAVKYFRIHILISLVAISLLVFAEGEYSILTLAGVAGFGCSSIFAVVCAITLKTYPDKVNEISVLMMTGISGGALVPVLMGVAADFSGSQTGALAIIIACMLYLVYCAFGVTFACAE